MASLFATDLFAVGLFDPGLFEQEGLAPTVISTGLSVGVVGTPYSFPLQADGDLPMTWSVTVGTLPAPLTLNASSGIISGTPAAPSVTNFTVQATNTHGSDTQALTLNIIAAGSGGGNDILPVPTVKGKGILRSPLKFPIGF